MEWFRKVDMHVGPWDPLLLPLLGLFFWGHGPGFLTLLTGGHPFHDVAIQVRPPEIAPPQGLHFCDPQVA